MTTRRALIAVTTHQSNDGTWSATAHHGGQTVTVYDNVTSGEALVKAISLVEQVNKREDYGTIQQGHD